jgi:hypothetical protein
MNRRRPWTEKEQHDLLQWAAQGISIERIAVRLNRTVMAVQNRLYALKGKAQEGQEAQPAPGQAEPEQTPPAPEQADQEQTPPACE